MKTNELFKLKVGMKIRLKEDASYTHALHGKTTMPKGLVLSFVSIRYNQRMLKLEFRAIRNRNIVESVYKPAGIPESAYMYTGYRGDRVHPRDYKMILMEGQEAMDFLDDITIEDFTDEYDRLTKLA